MPEKKTLFDHIRGLENAKGKKQALEQEIWERFGCTRAILIMDSTGFTRTTASHGILHYLGLLAKLRALAKPVLDRHHCLRYHSAADNLYGEFKTAVQALDAAIEVNRVVADHDLMLTETERFHVCSGIGFGRLLDSGDEGLYGPETNLASKLGEDTAEAGEILLTPDAFDAIPGGRQADFEKKDLKIAGCDVPYYRTCCKPPDPA